ncbi:MAG: hypothetical protein RRC34_09930 [Lentisphaeria bacterium]|nr:hypothetical protein [Lentisphaeria bacterium]
MRFLFISTLFPNSVNPTRALYNLRHLTALRTLGHSVDIIAPVPWFPGLSLLGRAYPPKHERYEGFEVSHPRFVAPPRTWVHKHHLFYRRAVAPVLEAWIRENWKSVSRESLSVISDQVKPPTSDLHPSAPAPCALSSELETGGAFRLKPVHQQAATNNEQPTTKNLEPKSDDLHVIIGFAYPDAVAMTPVCESLGLDYSIFVLGSDFRLRVKQPAFADGVMKTLAAAPRIFCPGRALRGDMVSAGLDAEKIFSFNNGVDTAMFHP